MTGSGSMVMPTQELNVVSIVVRVRNAARDLAICLDRIQAQELPPTCTVEIVVVDNESSDNTVQVAKAHGATVVAIARDEFTWGRALNAGLRAASGSIAVVLSADAYPANCHWLERLLQPFTSNAVAAVYARQIPRSDAPIDECVRLLRTFTAEPVRSGRPCENAAGFPWASNSCAAMRRSAWEAVPFDEEVEGAEEIGWIEAIQATGGVICYAPDAVVYHSHRDPIFRHACRLWELHLRACRLAGRTVSMSSVLRYMASFAKRRITNCFAQLPISLGTRVAGLARLPAEAASLAYVGAAGRDWQTFSSLRDRLWG